MKTMEQILNEIQNAMILNKDNVAKCNVALSNAKGFIMHKEKELQDRLEEEYKRGMNETWEIARELCTTGCKECAEIFGYSSVENIIRNYTPKQIMEKIASFRKENDKKEEIIVGNIVIDRYKEIKAAVLELDHTDNTLCVFTQNGDIEYWFYDDIENTGEFVDINNILFK